MRKLIALLLTFAAHPILARNASFTTGFPLPDNIGVLAPPAKPYTAPTAPPRAPGSTQTTKMTYASSGIVAIVHEVFDPVGVGDQAVRIAMCESSLNPRASVIDTDGTYADGLFQIHPSYWSAYVHGDIFDPLVNARAALGIWRHNGNSFAGLWACR